MTRKPILTYALTSLKATLERDEGGRDVMENGNHRNLMERVTGYVKQVKEIDKETEKLEEELKQLKATKQQITQYDLPDLMFEHGVNSLRLLDDTRVEIKPFYYARVDKEKELAFYEWLRKNGHGGLIKGHLEVWTTDSNLLSLIAGFCEHVGIKPEVKDGIHWKTLEKWFQEVTVRGVAVDTNLFTSHLGNVANIK